LQIIEEKYSFKQQPLKRSKSVAWIVVHHAAAQTATQQQIHQWHLGKEYIGIGYHFYIRKDGKIYRGRAIDAVGAHTLGYNDTGIGVCLEGDFTKERSPQTQQDALADLCRSLLKSYPTAKIVGHGQLGATACPGHLLDLGAIIKKVQQEGSGMVQVSPWAKDAWEKACKQGLFDGTNPGGAVSREMLSVILDRLGLIKDATAPKSCCKN
jgi:N-acetyl-anhydromuramyl-L-alanine amidase AmpD